MRLCVIFCFKQKTAYEMRISDWSSDGCSSDLFRTFGSREIPELRDNGSRAVAVGGNGDLLVATSRGGVSVRRRGVWTSYTKADGLAQNESMAIAEDRAGNIWVAHESEGVSRIGADGSIRVIDVLPGEDSGLTYAVFVDHTDVVWVGSGEGLVRIEGKRVLHFDQSHGMPTGAVFAIAQSADGVLSVATEHDRKSTRLNSSH